MVILLTQVTIPWEWVIWRNVRPLKNGLNCSQMLLELLCELLKSSSYFFSAGILCTYILYLSFLNVMSSYIALVTFWYTAIYFKLQLCFVYSCFNFNTMYVFTFWTRKPVSVWAEFHAKNNQTISECIHSCTCCVRAGNHTSNCNSSLAHWHRHRYDSHFSSSHLSAKSAHCSKLSWREKHHLIA